MGSWKDRFEELRRRVDDLVRDLAGVTRPQPELVPVPVRVHVPGQRRGVREP